MCTKIELEAGPWFNLVSGPWARKKSTHTHTHIQSENNRTTENITANKKNERTNRMPNERMTKSRLELYRNKWPLCTLVFLSAFTFLRWCCFFSLAVAYIVITPNQKYVRSILCSFYHVCVLQRTTFFTCHSILFHMAYNVSYRMYTL